MYATQEQRRDWMEAKVVSLAAQIAAHETSDANLTAAARYWFERLKIFSIFSKHSGFREEREWRVVYMRERDQRDRLSESLGYLVSAHGVEPKLKLPIAKLGDPSSDAADGTPLIAGLILGGFLAARAAHLERLIGVCLAASALLLLLVFIRRKRRQQIQISQA